MNTTHTGSFTPKYRELYQWLADRIYDGTYKYQQKLPSESALCRQFSISRQTVRNAMDQLECDGFIIRSKGSGSFVSKRVRKKEKLIGVLFTTLGDYINSNILTGLESIFTQHGYSMLLEQSHNRIETETLFLEKMLNSKVSGLIIEGTKSSFPSPNEELYRRLSEMKIPYIFINNYFSNISGPSVIWDDEKVSYLVTEQLIKSGHKKIAGLFRFDETQGPNRYLGYVKALMDNHLPIQEDYISWYCFSGQPGEQKRQYQGVDLFVEDVLENCTALICYNDFIACHVVPYLTSRGVRIPDDLTVVSFDNSDITKLYDSKQVPSIEHPKEKLGEMAARLLLRYIEDPTLDPTVSSRVKFPVLKEQEVTFERVLRFQTDDI
ncbi:MAG TPA: GntR family transcriptional regulator [Candidatus Choladousia intestinavium]|uniref:GntR family transcriptional regulator n=1 Tax=Candidatus Choladousia intestinavium TaxID=2840727 RepID=A0A9D1ADY3_9FIRM|nr:GntR family transcriptional regulator [Candidatus Choladousia intestinavium]